MTFQYRTPLEDMVSRMPSSKMEEALTSVSDQIIHLQDSKLLQNFSFHMPDQAKKWLTSYGIQLSPFPYMVHSHPVCKTLENHFLYNVLPSHLENLVSCCFLSIKKSKVDILKRRNSSLDIEIFNRAITSRDYSRYGPRTSIMRMGLKKHSNFFIHDELHYWTPGQLQTFLELYSPNTVLATVVFPIEVLHKYDSSLIPFCYEFRVSGDDIHFFPDGARSEAYIQPISGGDILKRNSIYAGKIHYSVDLISNIGAHSLICIKKCHPDTFLEKKRFFGPYPTIDAGCLFETKGRVPLRNISKEVLTKIIGYLLTLKKSDTQSAIAKLRQVMADDFDLDGCWVVMDLVGRLQKGMGSWANPSVMTILGDCLKDACPIKNTTFSFRLWDDFDRKLYGLKDLEFEVNLEKDELADIEDPISLIEKGWFGSKPLLGESSPYIGILDRWIHTEIKFHYLAMSGWQRKGAVVYWSEREPTVLEGDKRVHLIGWESKGNQITAQDSEQSSDEDDSDPQSSSGGSSTSSSGYDSDSQDESEEMDGAEEPPSTFSFGNLATGDGVVTGTFSGLIDHKGLEFVKLRGREAAFVAEDSDLVYFHDKVSYRTNKSNSSLTNLMRSSEQAFNCKFNSALIQIYRDNSSIPRHKDDEECYDSDPILTINLEGEATFTCKAKRYKLLGGQFILMTQKEGLTSHSVEVKKGPRISVTLRNQVRQIGFEDALKVAENFNCLIRAVAKGLKMDHIELSNDCPKLVYRCIAKGGLDLNDAKELYETIKSPFSIVSDLGEVIVGKGQPIFHLLLKDNHYSLLEKSSNFDSLTRDLGGVSTEGRTASDFAEKIEALMGKRLNKTLRVGDKDAGLKLLNSLWAGTTGLLCTLEYKEGFRIIPEAKDPKAATREIKAFNPRVEFRVFGIFGFAGSGKSNGIQSEINRRGKAINGITMISPRVALQNDWISKCPNLRSVTFESALKSNLKSSEVIILDEVNLFPRGYIDLLLMKLEMHGNTKCLVIMLGDPIQSLYFEEKDRNKLVVEDEISRVFNKINYIHQTYRCPKDMSARLCVPSLSDIEGVGPIKIFPDLPTARSAAKTVGLEVEVILCASRLEKSMFEGVQCLTYGESQGLTFNYGLISLSEETRLTSDNQILTALTRFRKGCAFLYNAKGEQERYQLGCKGLLKRILGQGRISKEYLENMFRRPVEFILPDVKGSGPDEVDREERLSGDPWLKGQIFLGQRSFQVEEEFLECEVEENNGKVHLPISIEKLVTTYSDKIRNKGYREINSAVGLSDQFRDSRRNSDKGTSGLTNCTTAESIYPLHKPDDTATFIAAVNKRLRFSNPERNLRKLQKATTTGKVMLESFLEHVQLDTSRDQALLDECRNEFEVRKLQKSKNDILKFCSRSDPDAREDEVRIFLKNQLCTKFEKRFVDAKAGQTIACFHHNVLVRFSPYCRYLEAKLTRALRKTNFYIHQKKNFAELNNFVKKNYRGGVAVESDYEAFDASQDANVLAFEVALLERMQMDRVMIDDYITLKTTLGCRMGSMAIMRFTGEFSTFLFNTLANMAFTFLRYEVRPDSCIMFAGDDMCALSNLRKRGDKEYVLNRLSLKAKVLYTRRPLFCGWRITRFGLFKEPALMYERLLISKEKERVHECLNSYFLEFMYAYQLGAFIEEVMDEDQMFMHHRCVRFFLQRENHLSPENRKLIHEKFWEDGYSSN